ncbi:phosphotransferase [Streptomyces sp. AC550_RSS872]|uniref:phosphotransferase n=1 Tax=Streptomyces sp. AC550_RSS872 TaxID=2823689 RepID=UPI001C26CC1D|nr:phosphotransferase [Streptomyces sp. AC550_RSS872]
MTAATSADTVRRMEGPFVLRLCVRTPSGFRWAERDKVPQGAAGDTPEGSFPGRPGYLNAVQLAALRAVVPATGTVRAAFPTLSAQDGAEVATWPALPTPALLCDRVYAIERRGVEHTCRELGRFLGRLHSGPPPELPRRHGSPWLPEGSPTATAVANARDRLPHGKLARSAARLRPYTGDLTIVHGRFSTGVCADTDRPVVLGWREAGLGDPLRDVAFFLSELIEAAAVMSVMDDPAPAAFLDGYGQVADPDRLRSLIADRLLEHCAQSALLAPTPAGDLDRTLRVLEDQWERCTRGLGWDDRSD